MATRKQIAWSELKVGVLVVVSLAILSAIVVLVLGVESPFARKYTLYTYLPNIGGLRPGSSVMLDGVTIGTVESFEFSKDLEKGIKIRLRLQKQYQDRIRTDSIAKLRSLGLLGDKYIEINQGTVHGRPLNEGETITGAPPLDLDQMIARATHSFDNLSDTVDNIKVLTERMRNGEGTVGRLLQDDSFYKNANEVLRKMHEGKGTMASFLNDRTLYRELSTTASNLRKVTSTIETGEGTVGKLLNNKEMGDSLHKSVQKIEGILARMDKGEGSLGKLSTDPALYNNVNELAKNLKPVTERVSRGEGTVGQLFVDKKLYENTNKFMSEMFMLVHDVRQDPKKYLRIKFSIF
ncbi:MAG TPA: MlaD family protein [Acidobacteriota bacterium]|nr:MlaD family protein [Acidobacteriota bacterium]